MKIRLMLAAAVIGGGVCAADWKLPDPMTANHPGAEAAPDSSPRTFVDAEGFAARKKVLIEGLAKNDLQTWRRGYFTGGDPGKYTHGPIMAKLLLEPTAKDAIAMQNEARSLKEQYHFACVNWSRTLPIFGSVLTEQSQQTLAGAVDAYTYLGQGGTENHKTMWITAANVLPWYTTTGRMQRMNREQALARAKQELHRYVSGLYTAGPGEWDSSTYYMFTINGLMNIYDFSKDEDARLLAKAGLDLLTAQMALKYTDGLFCSPNQRGFAAGPVQTIADQTNWLWWGSNAQVTAEQTRRFNYAMHAATSSYRPNVVISNIAQRKVTPLPFEQRNGRGNYWYGQNIEPRPNAYLESLYVTRHATMGSLWNGFGSQMTRFQIAAASEQGGVSFTGGYPEHWDHVGKRTGRLSFRDGNGGFDQSAQVGPTYISLSRIPAEETTQYSFFTLLGEQPVQGDGWVIQQAGKALVAVRGLGDRTVIGQSDLTPAQKAENDKLAAEGKALKHTPLPIVRFEGLATGFIVELSDTDTFADAAAFLAALKERTRVDSSRMKQDMAVSYTSLAGRRIDIRHVADSRRAEASVDGQAVDFDSWKPHGGPLVTLEGRVLRISDGQRGFVVDFRGELPVYRGL